MTNLSEYRPEIKSLYKYLSNIKRKIWDENFLKKTDDQRPITIIVHDKIVDQLKEDISNLKNSIEMTDLEKLLELVPDDQWDWEHISMNPNITLEYIEKNLDKKTLGMGIFL